MGDSAIHKRHINVSILLVCAGERNDTLAGARTMEIGPIRNQNLISWPLANDLSKIGEGQQKIIVRTNQQSNLRGDVSQEVRERRTRGLPGYLRGSPLPIRNQNLIFWPLATQLFTQHEIRIKSIYVGICTKSGRIPTDTWNSVEMCRLILYIYHVFS